MTTPSVLVLRAAGTNCDAETGYAFEVFGARSQTAHVNELLVDPDMLRRHHVLAVPGGFAYGDDVAAGAVLACEMRGRLGEPLAAFVEGGGLVLGILPGTLAADANPHVDVAVATGMGDARNLMMALAGDACIVIGGRAGTISEVCLAWLHRRPLLPLVGCGGWSDGLLANPPDERRNASILPWGDVGELEGRLRGLGLVAAAAA